MKWSEWNWNIVYTSNKHQFIMMGYSGAQKNHQRGLQNVAYSFEYSNFLWRGRCSLFVVLMQLLCFFLICLPRNQDLFPTLFGYLFAISVILGKFAKLYLAKQGNSSFAKSCPKKTSLTIDPRKFIYFFYLFIYFLLILFSFFLDNWSFYVNINETKVLHGVCSIDGMENFICSW